VKMHSAVFGMHPESVAAIVADLVDGTTATVEAEVLDLDEEKYRQGDWVVRLYATARTLHEPTLIQTGKMTFEELPEVDARDAIAEHLIEEMEEHPDTVYLLGPGGTLDHVKRKLAIRGSLLGVDAVKAKTLLAADLDEAGLGRGNQELSPAVLHRIGIGNIIVVATPDKLRHTPALRVDTGDSQLDREFAAKEYMIVVQGYREMKVHPIRA